MSIPLSNLGPVSPEGIPNPDNELPIVIQADPIPTPETYNPTKVKIKEILIEVASIPHKFISGLIKETLNMIGKLIVVVGMVVGLVLNLATFVVALCFSPFIKVAEDERLGLGIVPYAYALALLGVIGLTSKIVGQIGIGFMIFGGNKERNKWSEALNFCAIWPYHFFKHFTPQYMKPVDNAAFNSSIENDISLSHIDVTPEVLQKYEDDVRSQLLQISDASVGNQSYPNALQEPMPEPSAPSQEGSPPSYNSLESLNTRNDLNPPPNAPSQEGSPPSYDNLEPPNTTNDQDPPPYSS